MTSLILGSVIALGASADAGLARASFEFRDEAAYEGRSLLRFREIELFKKLVQALDGDFTPSAGAMCGQLRIGPGPETAMAVVWHAKADDGPTLWFDANGDCRLTPDERHVLKDREVSVQATLALETRPRRTEVTRTIVFRRPLFGTGLQYAVRGYALGTLALGSTEHNALLVDHNGDGRLNSAGEDRVWIDLDCDGHIDGLSEQFPLGRPIVTDGQVYLVRSDPLGKSVSTCLRGNGKGQVRFKIAEGQEFRSFKASLVSHLGEMVAVDRVDGPVTVPEGRYTMGYIECEMVDQDGQIWTYGFSTLEDVRFEVVADQETGVAILQGLSLDVRLHMQGDTARPGEKVFVSPRVSSQDGKFYLAKCTRRLGEGAAPAESKAKIQLRDSASKLVTQATSGFA